ncbi:MFS transporter [Pseudooceanicola aestuarii]|uniref:MFS transporter n=1 Tax=Pseudooceanicola aestuarii TaxID=2697319 RepID=UPI0013D8C4E2|nr:MFS transporter [Pseudooceanicola aestuarii]
MNRSLDSRYSWARLALSLLIAVVGNAGMWSAVVVMPAVQAEFATGRGEASLPYTLTMIGFALGNMSIGRAVDRFGVVWSMSVAALICSLGYVAAAASPGIGLLSAAQLLIGLGTAAYFGPLIADISLWFRRRRGIAVAIAASGNYLAGAIWPILLAGVLADSGWRAAYLVLGVCATVLIVPLSLALRRRLPAAELSAEAQGSALSARRLSWSPAKLTWVLGVAGVGCCVAMSMPQVHIVSLCVDMGFGPAVGAEMLSLMLLGGVGSRLVSGVLADWLGGVKTLLIGSVLQMLALALYLPAGGLTSLYVVSLVFGLAQGGIVPSYAIIVREYMPAQQAGARVGFVIMLTIFGMALGGWLSGLIYEVSGSYTLAFLNGIAFNGVNIAIMLLILYRSRPTTPRPVAEPAPTPI